MALLKPANGRYARLLHHLSFSGVNDEIGDLKGGETELLCPLVDVLCQTWQL